MNLREEGEAVSAIREWRKLTCVFDTAEAFEVLHYNLYWALEQAPSTVSTLRRYGFHALADGLVESWIRFRKELLDHAA